MLQLDSWQIRSSDNGEVQCEEELYVCGKTVVWSRGSKDSDATNDSRVVLSSFTCETPVRHALWCTFHASSSGKAAFELGPNANVSIDVDEPTGGTAYVVDFICVALTCLPLTFCF